MNPYSLLIFVHVLGAMGIFVAMGIESVSLGRLRRAETSEEAGEWLRFLALPGGLGAVAMVTTVASGIWMMAVAWNREAWMPSAFGAVVVMAVVGGAVTNRRVRRLRAALAPKGDLPEVLRRQVSNRALVASLRIRIALGVGILGLMTIKPDLVGSLLILATATAGGLLVASVPSPRRRSPIGEATHG